jgi:uncharacterized protein
MEMNRNEQISLTEEFVKTNLKDYDSGHDWWHIERVRKLASFINEMEQLEDPFRVEITALLHDTADSKFAGENKDQGYHLIATFMEKCEMSEIKDRVIDVIRKVSFSSKNNREEPEDPLLWIIQDADRLDAIGAIGIARAFNYGGFRNRAIYIPGDNDPEKSLSTISHFYDKLLKLKDMMNTTTGRRIAEERHLFLQKYLEQFYMEWDFILPLSL